MIEKIRQLLPKRPPKDTCLLQNEQHPLWDTLRILAEAEAGWDVYISIKTTYWNTFEVRWDGGKYLLRYFSPSGTQVFIYETAQEVIDHIKRVTNHYNP